VNTRKLRWIVGSLVLVAAFGLLFRTASQGQFVYYLSVGEYLDQAGRPPAESFRISGTVVPGSIIPHAGSPGAIFDMTDGNRRLRIDYSKELPDTFVGGAEAVVEGAQRPDGVFAAHTLLAKCPSKYEPDQADPGQYAPPASREPAQ
jgi:cytochrome c-type biogenesis protein CcmE